VTEHDLLRLEREHFLELLRLPLSQARMEHMLATGKPLRN
jgi:3-hydroxyacyl-CoA dehydrogenase